MIDGCYSHTHGNLWINFVTVKLSSNQFKVRLRFLKKGDVTELVKGYKKEKEKSYDIFHKVDPNNPGPDAENAA